MTGLGECLVSIQCHFSRDRRIRTVSRGEAGGSPQARIRLARGTEDYARMVGDVGIEPTPVRPDLRLIPGLGAVIQCRNSVASGLRALRRLDREPSLGRRRVDSAACDLDVFRLSLNPHEAP